MIIKINKRIRITHSKKHIQHKKNNRNIFFEDDGVDHNKEVFVLSCCIGKIMFVDQSE